MGEVHCKAREGYMKTGATVPLEGDDREICREAEIFWKERHMRDKRSCIIAAVRNQHQAGRLPYGVRHNIQWGLFEAIPQEGYNG